MAARLRAAGCVWAEDEARLIGQAAGSPAEAAAMADRRAAGEPIERVVGWAEFCALRIAVAPGVFIPRRRTEFLARLAAERAGAGTVVLDLCCGTGAIPAAVAAAVLPARCEVWAADVEPAAVECARRNLAAYGATVLRSDLFADLPDRLRGRVGVLTANVPYVPTDELGTLPAEARDHEPRVALDGGPDGLEMFRRVVAESPAWLAPGGALLSEVAAGQVAGALEAVGAAGLRGEIARDDARDAAVVVAVAG